MTRRTLPKRQCRDNDKVNVEVDDSSDTTLEEAINDIDSTRITNRRILWTDNQVESLLSWAKDNPCNQRHAAGFNEIADIIGRSAKACYIKFHSIEKTQAANQEMTVDDLACIKIRTSGQEIP